MCARICVPVLYCTGTVRLVPVNYSISERLHSDALPCNYAPAAYTVIRSSFNHVPITHSHTQQTLTPSRTQQTLSHSTNTHGAKVRQNSRFHTTSAEGLQNPPGFSHCLCIHFLAFMLTRVLVYCMVVLMFIHIHIRFRGDMES